MISSSNPALFGITPFTTLDYPDKIAAIAWFAGCNLRCAYCYNAPIVLDKGKIDEEEFCAFLDKRINKLDGIVFSGGECTISRSFLNLAREVKKRGFSLKVDTNGTNLGILNTAIDENLIDYIALDFKAHAQKYRKVTSSNLYFEFTRTLEYLISINFNFEVRTTVHSDLLNEDDISNMAEILYEKGYRGDYFLQNFLNTGDNLGNLKEPKNNFDISKVTSKLNIKLRNF